MSQIRNELAKTDNAQQCYHLVPQRVQNQQLPCYALGFKYLQPWSSRLQILSNIKVGQHFICVGTSYGDAHIRIRQLICLKFLIFPALNFDVNILVIITVKFCSNLSMKPEECLRHGWDLPLSSPKSLPM